MKTALRPKIDFLILTSLLEEFGAVMDVFSDNSKIGHLKFPVEHNQARMIKVKDKESTRTGIIACTNSMGASDSAIITSYFLSIYKFKVVVLAGIAGGVPNRQENEGAHLGDVVISNAIIASSDIRAYSASQFSKDSREMYILRPKTYRPEHELNHFVRKFARQNSKEHLEFSSYHSLKKLSVHVGAYLTVNGVISSNALTEKLLDETSRYLRDRIIAMEMEGYSIARSVEVLAPDTAFIICKGINDYLDKNKSSDELMWRDIACLNSAKVAKSFLQAYLDDQS